MKTDEIREEEKEETIERKEGLTRNRTLRSAAYF